MSVCVRARERVREKTYTSSVTGKNSLDLGTRLGCQGLSPNSTTTSWVPCQAPAHPERTRVLQWHLCNLCRLEPV